MLTDVKRFKVALPDNFMPSSLLEGFGEGVCYIVNDLTNKELIRKNFQFERFKLGDEIQEANEGHNSIEEDMIIEGSTVFHGNDGLLLPLQPRKNNNVGSKDLTNEANVFKFKKGKYF